MSSKMWKDKKNHHHTGNPVDHPSAGEQAEQAPHTGTEGETVTEAFRDLYFTADLMAVQAMGPPGANAITCLRSLEELLERDKQREKDGFPRKIKVGRLVRPGKGTGDKVSVVPTTVEEKFIHDRVNPSEEQESSSGGSGEGEEGEVIGERPIDDEGGGGEGQAGQGEGGNHELESDAYEIGRLLTEKFQLPNLEEKGKKRSLSHYTYDLTDKHRGTGQLLDKKATLRKILETNIALGHIDPRAGRIDPTRCLVAPRDKVFRILSREMDYESQALVFFLRDYSGSMWGKPTETVVGQHVLIYSWLLYQYARQVETRFVLHDTEAREVEDFYTYYNLRVAGGTRVVSAFRLVNQIIEAESLYRDYNIYVFYGTDGDDWDINGAETLPEIRKTMGYANRVGITLADTRTYGTSRMEVYLHDSRMLEDQRNKIRMDKIGEEADEKRLIEGIRDLTSEGEGGN
ncbi:MAG: DUF444 family protein [Thermodesulfobacteriota bacterium]